MLQVVLTKSVASSRSAHCVAPVRNGGVKKVANINSGVSRRHGRLVTATVGPAQRFAMRNYTAQKAPPAADQESVWEDLDNVNDFYDPRWDSDVPEEEMGGPGLFGDMTDEEYAKLLGLVRGATGGEEKAPPNPFEDKMTSLAAPSDILADATATVTQAARKIKAFSLEGEGAATRLRIGTLRLPAEMLERIRLILKDYPRSWLKRDAKLLSEALRSRTVEQVTGRRLRREARSSGHLEESQLSAIDVDALPIEYNRHQAMAYIAHRVPGIFACNTKVFDEIRSRFPGFSPKHMMDFGSGPGTTTWAASQVWNTIRRYQLVEPSEAMINLSTRMLEDFPVDRRSFLHQGRAERFDLVVASYSLSELSDDAARRLHVMSIWEHLEPGGLFIVVEPGTPIGFKVVRQVRSTLLEAGAMMTSSRPEWAPTIVAPCPHAHHCPMSKTNWCHFIQRVERSATLRSTKGGVQNWENEKFSFIAISKGPLAGELQLPETHPNFDKQWSRLVRQPLKRGGHVVMDACVPEGTLERVVVSRKHGKELYTAARKSTWGDLFYLDHVIEAEEQVAQRPRRKWKQFKEAKRASSESSTRSIEDDFVEAQMDILGVPKRDD